MSPKTTLNKASDGGHRLRRCRESPPRKSDKKKKKKKKRSKKLKLKLKESEANKSLYICHIERHPGDRVSYVVRSIKLSDLLSSDSVDHLQLRQVGYKAGDDELPGFVGCGVLGSQIVFAGGIKPIFVSHPNPTWHRDVYVFETEPDKQPPSVIRKMDAKLLQAKYLPTMMEVGGKLYALSYKPISDPPSFEVFDPEMGTWSALPQPPFLERIRHSPLSYAVTGTKMFMSQITGPVCCFDVAHPHREWRLVRSMCQRGPFPFKGRALVLDLPGDDNKKIMFAYGFGRWYLGVYIMFLDENHESITRIADLKLPMLPEEFESAKRGYILHIGGQKACLVAPEMNLPEERVPKYHTQVGSHKTRVLPFRFDLKLISPRSTRTPRIV